MRLRSVTERQFAAILAGLRLYEALQRSQLNSQRMADVEDIATNGGTIDALSAEETDILCERLNCG